MAWNLRTGIETSALQGNVSYLSPIASCINFAATVLSTPPLTAPITRPVEPHSSRIRAISFPINSSYSTSVRIQTKQSKKSHTHHSPLRPASTYMQHKALNYRLPFRRVRHLRVELDTVERFGVVRDRCVRRRVCLSDDVEVRRHLRELVAV